LVKFTNAAFLCCFFYVFINAQPAGATREIESGLEQYGLKSGKYRVTLSLADEELRATVKNISITGAHLRDTVYKNFSNNQALNRLVEGIFEYDDRGIKQEIILNQL
jgi:hypothetical protein